MNWYKLLLLGLIPLWAHLYYSLDIAGKPMLRMKLSSPRKFSSTE